MSCPKGLTFWVVPPRLESPQFRACPVPMTSKPSLLARQLQEHGLIADITRK